MGHRVRTSLVLVAAIAVVGAACTDDGTSIDASFGANARAPSGTRAPTTNAPTTSGVGATTTTSTTTPSTVPSTTVSTTSTTTVSTTSTTTVSTTVPGPPPVPAIQADPSAARTPADPTFAATSRAFDLLAPGNVGATLTVSHGGEIALRRAVGTTLAGQPATADTPVVVASVSKLVVGIAIARLSQLGLLSDSDTVPWGEIGLTPHPGWQDVTIRELLEHSAGVPVARSSWFKGVTDCPTHLQTLLGQPPLAHRGDWTYSNGNFCVLGLVVAARSQLPLGAALQHLVFEPVGVEGAHLTEAGLLPGDMPHPHPAGVARLSRLGGAGNLIVSTEDLAVAVGRLTGADRAVLTPSTLFRDQYGFGHTGTIDGAKACVWALDDGATVVAAAVAGNSPWTGGGVCDVVVPAVAADLGLGLGGSTVPDPDP